MPAAPTYPGVYVEEIPSGVRTVTGVSTSVTAFIGRTLRGPTHEPTTLYSFGDFERTFGGLWLESPLSYALRDFFVNGGSQAIVVRVYGHEFTDDEVEIASKAVLTVPDSNGITLQARTEGSWGNDLSAQIETLDPEAAEELGVDAASVFTLILRDEGTGVEEVHRNVTMVGDSRRLDRVLESHSQLARVSDIDPAPDSSSPGSDGVAPTVGQLLGSEDTKTGLYALEKGDLFNLLCIPTYSHGTEGMPPDYSGVVAPAVAYCERKRALFIADPLPGWNEHTEVKPTELNTRSKNAALFFPRLVQPNPLRGNQLEEFSPCGAVAGVMARTDGQRGVWTAAAGLDAGLVGVSALSTRLTDNEIGVLNRQGVNCLRTMPAAGRVVWGARTLQGDDRLASEWKYLPVRRLALYIEESLHQGVQWAVFEPNDYRLWAQLRTTATSFMHDLFRKGAFKGKSPSDAYFVRCSSETTTESDIQNGIVNVLIGYAPLRPAEFVILRLQQIAGQGA